MSPKLPYASAAYQRSLVLPSPADVCRTPLSQKVRVRYAEDLEDDHWDEEPTRPLRLAALWNSHAPTEV